MKLRELKRTVRALSTAQFIKLDVLIHELLQAAERVEQEPTHSRRKVIGQLVVAYKTYQQELVRCGKRNCKCATGQLHGPYWYAYWSEQGRTRSQYIGKQLPQELKRRPKLRRGVR